MITALMQVDLWYMRDLFAGGAIFLLAVLFQLLRLASASVDAAVLRVYRALAGSRIAQALVLAVAYFLALKVLQQGWGLVKNESTEAEGMIAVSLAGWIPVVHIWLDFTIMVLFGRVRPYVALTLRANLASIALVMFFSVFTVPLYAVLSLWAWGKSQYRFGGYSSCTS